MKTNIKISNALFIGACSPFLLLLSLVCHAEAENPVLAIAKKNQDVLITQAEFTPVVERYQSRSKKSSVTKDEKIKLLREMARYQLIQDQDAVQALTTDPAVQKKVRNFEKNVILQKFLKENITDKINVTEDDMKAFYQLNKSLYALPAQAEASHILLRTRAEAENILGKLKEKGDFDQLVASYSIDLPLAIKEKGKMSLNPIVKGSAVKELDQALFTHAEGEITDIIETQYGFHIVRIDKLILVSYTPFKNVKKDIKKILSKQKYEEAYTNMTAELEKNAELEFFEDRIQ